MLLFHFNYTSTILYGWPRLQNRQCARLCQQPEPLDISLYLYAGGGRYGTIYVYIIIQQHDIPDSLFLRRGFSLFSFSSFSKPFIFRRGAECDAMRGHSPFHHQTIGACMFWFWLIDDEFVFFLFGGK